MTTRSVARAGVLRTLRAHLASYGVSADALFAEVGIDPSVISEPDALHAVAHNVALLEAAARATRNPAFALTWAASLPWSDLGVLGYVVLHSPTVGAALGNAARYLAIQQTAGELRLTAGARVATLSYHVRDPDLTDHGKQTEATLAVLVRACREGTGRATWAPREVRFRHRAPRATAAHVKWFGAPVRFDHDDDALVLASDQLREPFTRAEPGLLPILVAHADASLAKVPRTADFPAEVRRMITAAIGGGEVAIDAVASRLGLSARSLQRQLRDHGASFKQLVDETRLALATRYLDDPALSLTEAAYLLGYADLSAFSRAYRRWTGASPITSRAARRR